MKENLPLEVLKSKGDVSAFFDGKWEFVGTFLRLVQLLLCESSDWVERGCVSGSKDFLSQVMGKLKILLYDSWVSGSKGGLMVTWRVNRRFFLSV